MSLEDAVKHLGELRASPPDNTALVKAYQDLMIEFLVGTAAALDSIIHSLDAIGARIGEPPADGLIEALDNIGSSLKDIEANTRQQYAKRT